jgi:hypothetical protein
MTQQHSQAGETVGDHTDPIAAPAGPSPLVNLLPQQGGALQAGRTRPAHSLRRPILWVVALALVCLGAALGLGLRPSGGNDAATSPSGASLAAQNPVAAVPGTTLHRRTPVRRVSARP